MTNILRLAIAIVLFSSASALAQDATPAGLDSRWTPYVGCWTITQEAGSPLAVPPGTMVCVRPSGRSAVTITTTVDGKQVLEQTVVADGSAQPISQADCRGTQTSDWSRDGERLFTRVDLQCADRPARTVSGITLLANGQWIDAQATVVDGDHDLRVRRYRRSDQAVGATVTTTPMSVEDVIEASKKVQSHALEAALDEAGGRPAINSRTLKQLADAGVSSNVIDLMVAQAYPDRFQVERGVYPPVPAYGGASASSSVIVGSAGYPYSAYDPFYDSYYYYSPFAYPYYWGAGYQYRYGYPYRNYYNSFDYPGYYYFSPGGSIGSGGSSGSAQPGSPDSRGGDGVVVKGRGYTRVRPNSGSNEGGSTGATPTSRSGPTRTRSADSGSDSSSSPSSSSGSSNSSGSSSGGGNNSGGGNSSGGGRTAQPR